MLQRNVPKSSIEGICATGVARSSVYLILAKLTKKRLFAELIRPAGQPRRTRGHPHRIYRCAARFSHAHPSGMRPQAALNAGH